MQYGGINTAQLLSEIKEAEAYVKPPVTYPKWVCVLAFVFVIIKLIPTVLLIMIAWWGLSLLVLVISS